MRVADGSVVAAAALAEVLAARDSGDPAAVTSYEARFGVVPETPFPATPVEGRPTFEAWPAGDFERLWRAGRRTLAAA